MAGIVIGHGKSLVLREARREYQEEFVRAYPEFGNDGSYAATGIAPEDYKVDVSETLKHIRNQDFHVLENNREMYNIMCITMRPEKWRNLNNKSAKKVLQQQQQWKPHRNAFAPARGGNTRYGQSHSQSRP